eukprot:8056583-Pyramimonas_sp.AAC.1
MTGVRKTAPGESVGLDLGGAAWPLPSSRGWSMHLWRSAQRSASRGPLAGPLGLSDSESG